MTRLRGSKSVPAGFLLEFCHLPRISAPSTLREDVVPASKASTKGPQWSTWILQNLTAGDAGCLTQDQAVEGIEG